MAAARTVTVTNRKATSEALREAWTRAETSVWRSACGGHGRTGAALACLAVLDGVAKHEAVADVRRHYSPRAVETPWQSRFVARFK
jgi:hypothetical protein